MMSRSVPTVVLKLDDLLDSAQSRDGFAFVFGALRQRQIKAGFGILGSSCEGEGKRDYLSQVKSWHNSGHAEIWCHGYDHAPGEFSDHSTDEQKRRLWLCCHLLQEKCGISLSAFGAPYNADNEATAAALNAVSQLSVWMFPKHPSGSRLHLLTERVDMEPEAGRVDCDFLKDNFLRRPAPCIVVQGHPPYWNARSRAEFLFILDYLISCGCAFATPSESRNLT